MSLLSDPSSLRQGGDRAVERAFDALILRQLLAASGAFRPSGEASSPIFADLIADAFADALARAGRPDGGPDRPGALSFLPPGTAEGMPSPPLPPRAEVPFPGRVEAPPPGRAEAPPPGSRLDPATLVAAPARLTSAFGARHDPLGDGIRHHGGVDLAAAEGSEIVAAAAGVVRRVGDRGGYGQTVEIDHGGGVTTLYAHASELLVADGQRVEKGQPIARVGQTGRATGPHLHFEVRLRDRAVDPTRALKAYLERAE